MNLPLGSEERQPRPAGGPVRRLVTADGTEPTPSATTVTGPSGSSAQTRNRPPSDGSARLVGLALLVVVVLGAAAVCFVLWPVQTLVAATLLLLASPYLVAYIMRRNGKAHAVNGLVPRHGPRSLFWKLLGSQLYAIFGWQRLTKPSLSDREHQARDALWGRRHRQKIVTFLNSKGGSAKTAMCVWLAALLAEAIRQPPLAFDVNESPGGTADRLGIPRATTLTLREYLRQCADGRLHSHSELLDSVQWHRQTGVRVIASEAADDETFEIEQMLEGLRVLKSASHSVFCDCGNAILSPGNWGAVRMADTLVFTGNVNMADSLTDITNTMLRYGARGHKQQVRNAVVVIVGAKLEEREDFAKRYALPMERVFVVPPNRYMAKGEPVDLTKIPLQIRVILLEILVAIMSADSVHTDINAEATSESARRPRPHPVTSTPPSGA